MTGLALLKRANPSLLLRAISVALSTFLVADIANRIIEIGLASSLPGLEWRKAHTIPESRKDLKDLLLTPPKRTPTPAPSIPPSLRLIGTVVGRGTGSYAFFEDTKEKGQFMVKVGDPVDDGILLKAVRKDGAILLIEGKEVFLPFGERETPETSRLESVKERGRTLARREVEGAFKNLNEIMTQARVIPYTVDGRLVGYRIFSIRPGSIYSRIGLKNGDIVQRVNGVTLTTPEKAYLLFQQLRNEARITIDILRAGRKVTIPIEIR